ncbi:MAG: TetR/AcrR family transcriptional regulator [Bacteriovoracaceae bacterium]
MRRATKKNPVVLPIKSNSTATFEAILKATTNLIVDRGLYYFTSNEIAEEAGVAISSFYQYFYNKEAAINEVVKRFLVQDEVWFAELVNACMSMEEILQGAQEIMRRDPKLRKEILLNAQDLIGAPRVLERRRRLAELIEPFMPAHKFKTKARRRLGAQVVVHTFLSVEVGFMDVSPNDGERAEIQKEISGIILSYLR